MSDNVLPPTNPEGNSANPPEACASGCQHRTGNGLLRAVLYTPVVIVLGGLAALATFPDLAQYAAPLIDHLPKSAMNAKCPFQCQSSSKAIDLSNPVYHQEKSCCESSSGLSMRLAAIKRNAASAFSCCSDSAGCPASSEGNNDGALAMLITEDVSAESPADATAVANVADADSASN